MRMNYAEIIHSEVRYFLMNTAQKTTMICQNAYMLIDHYTILCDNEFDDCNL